MSTFPDMFPDWRWTLRVPSTSNTDVVGLHNRVNLSCGISFYSNLFFVCYDFATLSAVPEVSVGGVSQRVFRFSL